MLLPLGFFAFLQVLSTVKNFFYRTAP